MVMGAHSGSIDILGMVTYMDWPVIMGKGLTTNQQLIDAGIMFQADTIEELADKIGLPPEALAETVSTYNGYCDEGADPELDRGTEVYASYLFNAVKGADDISGEGDGGEELAIRAFDLERLEGPFVAVEVALGYLNSQGGAKRNGLREVLDLGAGPSRASTPPASLAASTPTCTTVAATSARRWRPAASPASRPRRWIPGSRTRGLRQAHNQAAPRLTCRRASGGSLPS